MNHPIRASIRTLLLMMAVLLAVCSFAAAEEMGSYDLYISEAKNVVAKNNTFKPAENNAAATIRVNHADNVTLSGNKYVDGRTQSTVQVNLVTNFKEN